MTPGDNSLINPRYSPLVYTAIAAPVLAAAACCTRWETLRIIGTTVLTGVGYGIGNDMFACRDCPEYFTVGHVFDGKNLRRRPLRTLEPNLNALCWGSIATWHVSAIAGCVLAGISRVPLFGAKSKVTAKGLAKVLVPGALALMGLAHHNARTAKLDPEMYYRGVPADYRSRWHMCNTRNTTGYIGLGIGGAALAIGIIAKRYLVR